jgi:hypothetical protein
MENFLQGVPPIEVYRASIENEVSWPACATEKGSSWAKREVGCELTSAARECSRQTSVLGGSLPFEVAAGRPTEYSISSDNLNWGNSRGKICLPLSVVWDFTVYNLWYAHTQTRTHTHAHARTHACACINTCTHAHTNAHARTHTCTHTHMHACTHTHAG